MSIVKIVYPHLGIIDEIEVKDVEDEEDEEETEESDDMKDLISGDGNAKKQGEIKNEAVSINRSYGPADRRQTGNGDGGAPHSGRHDHQRRAL